MRTSFHQLIVLKLKENKLITDI